MTDAGSIEVHKALADDTRFRLYRYLRLSGRPVTVRELAARLSLHPNTIRPHLRRLEEVGLVLRDTHRGTGAGRPQAVYEVVEQQAHEGRDWRLLAEILAGVVSGERQRIRAATLAREWGAYLVARDAPKPGARTPAGRNLATLREAMDRAGFEPRFRRTGGGTVVITMRDCPFRDLLDEHRALVCEVHRGLMEGMLAEVRPPLQMSSYEPLTDRATCRLTAGTARPS
ncbi:MAG: helix-turn-helix domain-containing protein [Actinomycetota bacterium]